MSAELKIGDKVIWRGGWGSDNPRVVTVVNITRTKHPHDKYGDDVPSIPWADIDYACVDLDNHHWAYGYQIKPLS